MKRYENTQNSSTDCSLHDHLTGLPSMTHFFDLAQNGCLEIFNSGCNPAVVFLDLSGMKSFNHKYGFVEGDNVLREFARILEEIFGKEKCSRFVQDHFVVYTCEKELENNIQTLFKKWKNARKEKALPVRAGVYLMDNTDFDIVTVCDNAKVAADLIRSTYVSRISYFNKELSEDIAKRDYIISNIDRAISEKWIQVYYQPIVRTVNGKVCDEEALSRWIDPEKGFLSPADFIDILEEAHLIYKLDLYVVDEIISKIKTIQEAGITVVPQSVNLSRTDFEECDIAEEICRKMDDAQIDHNLLTIEITESIIASDFEYMKTQVERFRNLGFKVWMDDFGSGYSSLDVLQDLAFDLIKFDMRFLTQLENGMNGKIILTELMRMANALGLETVCEGVETIDHVNFLGDIGCSKLQGYYYTKPLPLDRILQRYTEGKAIGFENPGESDYYATLAKINLYDLDWLMNEDFLSEGLYNNIPMVIMELNDEAVRIVRSNASYKEFGGRSFERNVGKDFEKFETIPEHHRNNFLNPMIKCAQKGTLMFVDETLPNNITIHTFMRRVAVNPVTGTKSVGVAVLSVTDDTQETTHANIANTLASDYYEIIYVDLKTEEYQLYISDPANNEFRERMKGKNIFTDGVKTAVKYLYKPDRADFINLFTKEKILNAIDEHGRYVFSSRIMQNKQPVYISIKIMRMSKESDHLIIAISNIDTQMKQYDALERIKREQLISNRICALVNDYLCSYTVNLENDTYFVTTMQGASSEFGFNKEGIDFFNKVLTEAKRIVFEDDYPAFAKNFSKKIILDTIKEKGFYLISYRLNYCNTICMASLKAAIVNESDGDKLILGLYLNK
ncbi:MAG: GGDEF domain-containing phosphodiesterase [Lachnospiraceae bacterium]|nr:GGDEF domain-containing phosphodiesterase [Lachnospiraceae bacterium]